MRSFRIPRTKGRSLMLFGRHSRTARVLVSVLTAAALAFGVSGCASNANGLDTSGSKTPLVPRPTVTPLSVVATPEHGTQAAWTTDTLILDLSTGQVSDVTATSEDGAMTIHGTLNGSTWTPERTFLPDTRYLVAVTGTDSAGNASAVMSEFTTLKPTITATYSIVYSGDNRGIATPVTVQFDSAVASEYRAGVEKTLKVTTTPEVEGSWGWVDSRVVQWRPAEYWAPGTTIQLDAPIGGLQTGEGKYVGKDSSATYNISSKARIVKVNTQTHQAQAIENGVVVNTLPVTTGQPGMVSRAGIKVISEKVPSMVMDSSTVGVPNDSPDGYKIPVKWAQRITWTGEFLHAADWSAASHGYANVSHGCTGLTTERAKWLYDFTSIGTPVEYTGNNDVVEQHEGVALWTLSYADWLARSALG